MKEPRTVPLAYDPVEGRWYRFGPSPVHIQIRDDVVETFAIPTLLRCKASDVPIEFRRAMKRMIQEIGRYNEHRAV